MKFPSPCRASALMALAIAILVSAGGCRKKQDLAEAPPPPVDVVALKANALAPLPGAIYRSQAQSPIHWQAWSKETLANAKAANRLIFAVIAIPQQPNFQDVLAAMASNHALVSTINDSYVPVIIDGDASREIGLLTADLCAEINRSLVLPLFVWMTPDGNPVAWIPVDNSRMESVTEFFNQSHSMVSRMWGEDSGYVRNNSAMDNDRRRERIAKRKNANVTSERPAEDTVRGIRQLSSLYDPVSRNFDQTGGLFPSSAIELLAVAAVHPGLPDDVRSRCLATLNELMADVLHSPMFDPLDGGMFSSKRGASWALPVFTRDCSSQARAALALIRVHGATGSPVALERALAIISFAEKSFSTTDGLYSVGLSRVTPAAAWLWSVEDVEKALPAADAVWWIKATGMKGLGNLPLESDPRKEFFRSNSLGMSKSMAEIAAENSIRPEEFAPRFEAARKTLLKIREQRLGDIPRDDSAHAGTTFRMVSAYAAAFGATGDPKYREKAISLLGRARTAFSEGPRLRYFAKEAPQPIGGGRAFLYGMALQSALDVADITSDENWLQWADDLATTAAELFTGDGFLKECPDDAMILDLPITDLVMIFDDSTCGLISHTEARMARRGRPLVKSFSDLAIPLPTYSVERPVLHTDLFQGTLARHFPINVSVGKNISPELKLAVERLPIRSIQRRAARPEEDVAPGQVKVTIGSGPARVVTTSKELQEAVLP